MTDFLKARWENLVMVNYEVDPDVLQPYLPKGVELDYYQDKTYVSLVGFMFKDTRIFNIPIPLMGTFEEINLRFYVKRIIGKETRRGVVFISEIIPGKMVAWTANLLYHEHYSCFPTKHEIIIDKTEKKVAYKWLVNNTWNSITVNARPVSAIIQGGSMEEFIFEHYYGYTKIDDRASLEYRVNHPRWQINEIRQFEIQCDFQKLYGDSFKMLDKANPHSVMLAQGSDVSVKWKRESFEAK
jgi:uncharacterized protein